MRDRVLAIVTVLAACAGPKLPPPNSAQVQYDMRQQAVQVMVSSLQPPSAVALVSANGQRYPASGIALLSGPHVLYNPPPSRREPISPPSDDNVARSTGERREVM
jgi:hypothetical protein